MLQSVFDTVATASDLKAVMDLVGWICRASGMSFNSPELGAWYTDAELDAAVIRRSLGQREAAHLP